MILDLYILTTLAHFYHISEISFCQKYSRHGLENVPKAIWNCNAIPCHKVDTTQSVFLSRENTFIQKKLGNMANKSAAKLISRTHECFLWVMKFKSVVKRQPKGRKSLR